MHKIPGKSIFYGLVFAVLTVSAGILVSCSASKYHYQDGYYTAEAAEFDAHGWKEYVTVYVSTGQILLVEYNAFNTAGFIKSWDMDYMRVMNASDGTYPNAYTRYYGEKLLTDQGIQNIDIISGATHSYYSFLQLAEAVLENARRGDGATRTVTLNIPGQH